MSLHLNSPPAPLTEGLFHIKFYRQWIGAFGVIMLLVQLGGMTGWTSPYMARLTIPGGPMKLNNDQASWMASLLNVGRFVGAILGGVSVDYWGSKRGLLLCFVPVTLSWLFIMIATEPYHLYIARIFGGLGIGMGIVCFPLFIGEIALPQIRGAMITVAIVGGPFGVVVGSVAGHYLSLMWSSILFLVPCLLVIGLFLWLPDSPHYLMKIGNDEAAWRSIAWYRRNQQVNEEFVAVKKYLMTLGDKGTIQRLADFKHPALRRALAIVLMLYFYIQASGQNSIVFYMELIFRKGKTELIPPAHAVVLINVVGCITLIIVVNLMDSCGRRVLLMTSGIFVCLAQFALGTHFLLISHGHDPQRLQWLPIVSIFVFSSAFCLGLTPVPNAVLSEIFPASVKCVAACMASSVGGIFSFVISKSFHPLCDLVGDAYVFYGYAVIIFTMVPVVYFILPETKGKTLLQIQEELLEIRLVRTPASSSAHTLH